MLFAHLLKWQLQPEHQSRSGSSTVLNERHEIAALLDEMPSLHRLLEEAVPNAYRRAVEIAAAETGFPRSRFAQECPFPLKKVFDTRLWPRSAAEPSPGPVLYPTSLRMLRIIRFFVHCNPVVAIRT